MELRYGCAGILLATIAAPHPASAQEKTETETPRVEGELAGEQPLVPPLDLTIWPQSRGLGAAQGREQWALAATDVARVDLIGLWWANDDDATQVGQARIDSPARGWSAGANVSLDFAVAELTAHASLGYAENALGRGDYREIGLALRRTFRLSRNMLAWISLGIGRRTWSESSTLHEQGGTELMLTIGTTFR